MKKRIISLFCRMLIIITLFEVITFKTGLTAGDMAGLLDNRILAERQGVSDKYTDEAIDSLRSSNDLIVRIVANLPLDRNSMAELAFFCGLLSVGGFTFAIFLISKWYKEIRDRRRFVISRKKINLFRKVKDEIMLNYELELLESARRSSRK